MLSLLLSLAHGPHEQAFDVVCYMRAHRGADTALASGRAFQALSEFTRCLELSPRNPTIAYGLACAEAQAGRSAAALGWLEAAVEWGYRDLELMQWDPDLVELRKDPRFRELLPREPAPDGEDPGELLRIEDVHALRWSPDAAIDAAARLLAVGWDDGAVSLLDARSGREQRRWRFGESAIWTITFLDGDERLAALTWDGTLLLWSISGDHPARSGQALVPPEDGETFGWPFGAFLEAAPSGERILVGGRDRGASLWTRDGDLVRRWDTPFGGFFGVRLAWRPDGKVFAAADEQRILLFDAGTGEPLGAPLVCTSKPRSLAFHPGGALLATGHKDGHLRLWDLDRGAILYEDFVESMFGAWVAEIAFSPDGRWLAYTSAPETFLLLADVQSRERVWISDYRQGRMGETSPIRWRADSKRLWSAFAGGVTPVYDDELGMPVRERVPMHGAPPRLSPAERGVVNTPFGLSLIDTETGNILWHRVETKKGAVLQASTGYFACDFDDLSGVFLTSGIVNEARRPLASVVRALFDPKRVRAAQAGVHLRRAEL